MTTPTKAPVKRARLSKDLELLARVSPALLRLARHSKDLRDVSVLELLRTVRKTLDDVKAAEAYIELQAGEAMAGRKRIVLEGRWAAERYRTADRKEWDHDGLTRAVVDRALITPDGEILEMTPAAYAVRDALTAAARPSWRVTALKAMDIDPDDYCHKQRGRTSVQFVSEEPE